MKKWRLIENGKRKQKSPTRFCRKNYLTISRPKFQLNRFRGCRLGVENVLLTFRNFRSEKTRKIYFLRHLTDLTRNRIITPNHLAITIGVLTGDMQQAKTLRGTDTNHYYQRFIVNLKLSFHVYRPRKLKKTFEAVALPPSIARKPRTMHDLSRTPCFSLFPAFLRRKCKVSLVRRTGFVLPLEHLSGTKYVNSPQLQRFLDKNVKSPIHLFQCFCFPDLQEAVNGHVETDGSHSALGCSFDSFNHCSFITLR